ncbi:MAG: hypothetical protein WED34_15020 [Planctomycetales bacterium]
MNARLVLDHSLVWLAPAAGLLLLIVVALWRGYGRGGGMNRSTSREPSEKSSSKSAFALKAVAFAILVLCLLDPLWSSVRARPGENALVFLVDDSRSLNIADEIGGRTRRDVVAALLDRDRSPWLVDLERQFDVRTYAFGARLRGSDGRGSMSFDEPESNLAEALAALRNRLAGAPLAGIVLLTDGNATDAAGPPLDLAGLPPIHPVALGGRAPLPDLAVRHVAVTRTVFEDAPVTIRAEVAASGLAGREITVELLDEADSVVSSETRTVAAEQETVSCEFRIGRAGERPRFHRVRASVQTRIEAGGSLEEATLANNVRTVVSEPSTGPHRVLYLAGRPNWEHKFLSRAVADDAELDLVALIRIARQEAKLQWRGGDGGSGNRLFRNFDDTPETERERYDEPVLIRLNTRNANELARGFPAAAEELFAFHAVVLDDLEADFLTHDQLALLRRFVADRGGSLLVLGGPQTFTGGGWDRTAIAEALPVNFALRRGGPPPAGPQRFALTREGWLQPWVRLRASEAEERSRLAEMPGFRVVSATGAVRPGATVLAEAVDEAGRHAPALVAHRYGHGRCAALTVGDLWRWQLQKTNDRDDLGRGWRQMLRWLVSDVPERVRVEVMPDSAGRIGNPSHVRVRVHARDAKHRPLDEGTVRVTIEPPEGEPLELLAEPSLDRPGTHEIEYLPRAPGAYRIRVAAMDGDGKEIGAGETGWAHEPAVTEFARIEPNREMLRSLADRTGGRMLSPEELPAFARGLPATDVPVTERVASPLWHRPWVFLLVLGCLAGEWGLRRRRGLR